MIGGLTASGGSYEVRANASETIPFMVYLRLCLSPACCVHGTVLEKEEKIAVAGGASLYKL